MRDDDNDMIGTMHEPKLCTLSAYLEVRTGWHCTAAPRTATAGLSQSGLCPCRPQQRLSLVLTLGAGRGRRVWRLPWLAGAAAGEKTARA